MLRRSIFSMLLLPGLAAAQDVPKFPLPQSGLKLVRPTRAGVFLDVAGPRSVFLGVENGGLEGWIYPLKVFQDMELSFRLEGYPVDIAGREIQSGIEVRPEATTLTYSHSAFTVRQILLAPRESGPPAAASSGSLVSLLDIDTTLPMVVTVSFRPRLRLMWPAGLQTPNASWDAAHQRYVINEESGSFSCLLGSPGARDLSTQPYQEEPKDQPLRFEIPVSLEKAHKNYVPILAVAPGKPESYEHLLHSLPAVYQDLAQHYQRLRQTTVQLQLPDSQLQEAYDWSLVGMDKGMVRNPYFDGPGLVAGFRTSGESERPGFAWFFGRDALWTALASNATGNSKFTQASLEFLRKHQRADGKIPHEISQSAPFVDWFKKFGFAWASADASPLYVVAHGAHFRRTGNLEYLKRSWPSIRAAFEFTRATDKDGDGLLENTGVGHAWVEGGALYPAHQELYLQGVFMEAAREYQHMARAMGESGAGESAVAQLEKVRQASERTYWLEGPQHYAFATAKPRRAVAEPGPNLQRRQHRLNELNKGGLVDEDTVLPSVPMIWGWLEAQRGQAELDHLGAADLTTDWGSRILSQRSRLYDPLAYHYGSVWPLFTGWVALAGYRYGRPEVALTALRSNCALTFSHSLGYVTELLSGDFCTNFGRSSYHQIWSEAMVAWPMLRGLVGLEVTDQGRTVEFAPQPPPHWSHFEVRQIASARGPVNLVYDRRDGQREVRWQGPPPPRGGGSDGPSGVHLVLRFFLPLNAEFRDVKARGAEVKRDRLGDQQRITVSLKNAPAQGSAICSYSEGTELEAPAPALAAGQRSQGLRILRCQAESDKFHLVAEGLAGQTYTLVQRGRVLQGGSDAHATFSTEGNQAHLTFAASPQGGYVRADLRLDYQR